MKLNQIDTNRATVRQATKVATTNAALLYGAVATTAAGSMMRQGWVQLDDYILGMEVSANDALDTLHAWGSAVRQRIAELEAEADVLPMGDGRLNDVVSRASELRRLLEVFGG